MSTDKSAENIARRKKIPEEIWELNRNSGFPCAPPNTAPSGEEQELGNWICPGENTLLSRESSESKLSLEGLDLELPTLEMYQEEFVDFPSSPTHKNFQPHALVGERDAGGSEDEEEDTSIYRAVLSPNCQDVRLRKDIAVNDVSEMVDSPRSSSVITSPSDISLKDTTLSLAITTTEGTTSANLTSGIVDSTSISVDSSEQENYQIQRKILVPSLEDAQLPDIGEIRVFVEDTSKEINPGPTNVHKSMESLSPMRHSIPNVDDGSDEEDNADFVFERRNSKRLSQYTLGERVIEGLFVESRNKDSGASLGLRKISVPDDVMNSPELDSKDSDSLSSEYPESPDREISRKSQSVVRKFPSLGPTNSDPGPGKPVPASRSKPPFWDSATDYTKMTIPPCPKPRRKNHTAGLNEPAKGCQLLLNPLTLDSQTSVRRVAKVQPDGSVKVEERPGSLISSQRGGRRRIRVTPDVLHSHGEYDDDDDEEEDPDFGEASSAGGRSSRLSDLLSPGEDLEEDPVHTPDAMEDSILERLGEVPTMTAPAAPIPEFTAIEERTEWRNWRSCVVQGIERRIDMKVIEPYKRVLSHGGYLKSGSHNAIIVFSACFLPDRSRVDYDYVMENLFLYVLTTLDQLITDDYVLVYLHGATARSCFPTFGWIKRCYHLIDRRLRKNLKALFLVHPTFWLKTIVLMTKPFISSKFSRKLRFIDSLAELAAVVPLELASIPDRVKQLDDDLEERAAKRRSLLNWWWTTQTPDTTTVSS